MGDPNEDLVESKRELRRRMRLIRRELPDRSERSARIVDHLVALEHMRGVHRLMVYDAVPGEVDLERLVTWAASHDIEVAVPESGIVADWPDMIVVPGTAFTTRGERVGQGGGWYDRFLPGRRPGAMTVGVCFAVQVVDDVPTEGHDVRLDCVVTEDGPI